MDRVQCLKSLKTIIKFTFINRLLMSVIYLLGINPDIRIQVDANIEKDPKVYNPVVTKINLMDILKSNSKQEIPASPSSELSSKRFEEVDVQVQVIDLYEASSNTQEVTQEIVKTEYNDNISNGEEVKQNIEISNLKDHDINLERINTNDSYLDCFIDNAQLNEEHIIFETPMHEQTVTSLEKDNFSEYFNFDTFRKTSNEANKNSVSDLKKAAKVIIENAPILLKPIAEFLLTNTEIESNSNEESKYDEKHNIKYDRGDDKSSTGEDVLFTINPDLDNLISNNQDVSVYCKFIDFYRSEMNQQTKFLYSLANIEIDSMKTHDFTAGSVCNMITCGVIKCNFDYIRGLLINPETEKLFNAHIESIDVKYIYGDMYQTIIYNKCLKAMSMWYRKRSFDLAHYSFDYNGSFYIIERSLDTKSTSSLFSVNANVLAKIIIISPKTRRESYIKKFYVVDYAGDWSTNNQIIQMALKETELEYFGISNYISLNFKENRTYIEESKESELRNILQSILPVPIVNEDH